MPGRRQVLILTYADILLIAPLGINFAHILITVQTFSFRKIHLNVSSGKCQPLFRGLNILRDNISCKLREVTNQTCAKFNGGLQLIPLKLEQWSTVTSFIIVMPLFWHWLNVFLFVKWHWFSLQIKSMKLIGVMKLSQYLFGMKMVGFLYVDTVDYQSNH